MKIITLLSLTLIVLLTQLYAQGEACTFTWDKVTQYTDGSSVTELVTYRLYFQPTGSTTIQKVAEVVDVVTATLVCPIGQYWLTALSTSSPETVPSNIATVKGLKAPTNLKWAN